MNVKNMLDAPVLKLYRVTYTALVWATDESDACSNMLDSCDCETSAEEVTE